MALAKLVPPADCSDPQERRRRIEAEPLPRSVWRLFVEAAAEAPDNVLWDFFQTDRRATYSEAKAGIERLAAGLHAHGVGRGSVVALVLPNIPEYPMAWLALARLGAVAVPINPQYTAREVQYVLLDADVSHVIVHQDSTDTITQALEGLAGIRPEHVFVLGRSATSFASFSALSDHGANPPSGEPDLDDLLSIQYTSGTTGPPKGCLLPHRHWLTCGKVNARRDGRAYSRILASTPFFYMDPHWLLLMTLFQRATLFVAARQSASHFMNWVREHRIEFCLFPELALKQPPSPDDGDNALIRMNIYGVKASQHAEIEQRFNSIAREAYGMTEMGNVMYMPMEAADMVGSGSCGMPSPFRECRIVTAGGKIAQVDEVGELQVRGTGTMLGYHNKPDANQATFDEGWFRTGDLFRKDARGYYYLVGRLKDMIRRSGENISAFEIEQVLRAIPEVLDAAVIGVPDDTRGEEVLAVLVTGSVLEPSHVLSECSKSLARFKVPRYLRFADSLPKTPSGKVAKTALREQSLMSGGNFYDRDQQR